MFTNPLRGLALLAAVMLAGTTASAATVTVTTNADSGAGSLRDTIAAAADGDTIVFDASLDGTTITLGGTKLTIDKNLIIDASALTGGITIDGNGASQVFFISNFEVELRKLVITGGGNEPYGAGVGSNGDLTLTDCTISGNTSTFRGGGIWSYGVLTASGCTISGNRTPNEGGGIGLSGSSLRPSGPVATFTNCTISGNQSYNAGTAFYMDSSYVPGFTLTLDHCTVSLNQADDNGSANSAIMINGSGQITVRNSIIARNSSNLGHPDFYGGSITWTIEGVNIIGNNQTVETQFPATAGLIGTFASPVNPLLGTLANNGGPTQTLAPQPGSPAINAATGTSPSTDQRGFSRNGVADIGAFEVQSSNANLTNLVLSDVTLDPTFDSGTLTYTATAAAVTASLTVTPTTENAGATITVNGSPVVSGAASAGIPLSFGTGNIVTVVVTAQDQVTTKTYTVDVTRISDNANLTDLVLNDGTLDPMFGNATLTYTATTASVTASLIVTPTAEHPGATITVNGSPVVSGAASAGIPLNFGAGNIVTVVVTAEDQVATKTYTLNVTRLPATTDSNGNGFSDLQEFRLGNLPSRFYVGEVVSLDLAAIFYPMPSGQSLAVSGLPPGLSFNATSGLISGTVLGLGSPNGVAIQIKKGSQVLHALLLDLAFEPYRPAGSYEVLLEDGGLPVGKLKLTIASPSTKSPNPAYTATLLRLGEGQRSAKGSITPGASPLTVSLVFPAFQTFPAVTYSLVISDDSDLVTGATNPASTVTARGFRLAKAGRIPGGNPALTLSFPPAIDGDRTTTPGGIGYAKGSVNSKALIPLSGLLGDAQAFTGSLCLSQTNQAVIWLTPYKNKTSYFGGIIEIGTLNVPGRNPATESATTGLKWARVLDATATSYPNGFSALSLTASTSRWYSVPKAEALGQALGLAFRGINASYVAPTTDALPTLWSLRDNLTLLRIAPTNAVPFTGKALGTNGTFTGNLTLPAPAAKSAMSGVFLQDESFGSLIGQGLIKVPITGPGLVKGSYQTSGIRLDN
jgi:hypothetical protein